MYSVHIFLDGKMRMARRMDHIPRSGETMRFSEALYATVTEVIWCMDEGGMHDPQRINLRTEKEKAPAGEDRG